MKLGAQLFSLRNFIKTPEDILTTFEKIKAMGFENVQFSGGGPIDAHELKAISEKTGLPIVCTHSAFDRILNDTDALIEEHKIFGCPVIGLGSMPAQFRTGKEGAEAFIKEFNEVSKKIAAAGMKFGYHNHDFEFERVDGRLIMDMLIEDTVPEFGFILDTFWLQSGGVSPMDYIKRVEGRMKVCHFKDMKIVRDEKFPRKIGPVFTEVGTGNLPLVSCMKACMDTGVSHVVIEQDFCEIDPFDSLAISFENLKKIEAAAAAL